MQGDDSNPADDEEHIILTDTAGRSPRRELIELIKDLEEDEAAAVVALAWIGRGDPQPKGLGSADECWKAQRQTRPAAVGMTPSGPLALRRKRRCPAVDVCCGNVARACPRSDLVMFKQICVLSATREDLNVCA